MTETEVRDLLSALDQDSLAHGRARLMPADRAIQTARQIGSSWPSDRVNLIHFPGLPGIPERYRMVIE